VGKVSCRNKVASSRYQLEISNLSFKMSPSKILENDEQLRSTFDFPPEANTVEYARSLDAKDPLRNLREQFIIPSKANLKTKKLCKVDG